MERKTRERASWAPTTPSPPPPGALPAHHLAGGAGGHGTYEHSRAAPWNAFLIILQPNGAAAPGRNKICSAYFKCFTYENWEGRLSKLFRNKVSNEHRLLLSCWSPGPGARWWWGGRGAGRPPAWSPLGLLEGAIWDFSEGHWEHILVS